MPALPHIIVNLHDVLQESGLSWNPPADNRDQVPIYRFLNNPLTTCPVLTSAASLERTEPATITGPTLCFLGCRRNLDPGTFCMEHGFEEPEVKSFHCGLARVSAELRVMSICIGDVRNTEQRQMPVGKVGACPIAPLRSLASRVIEGPRHEEPAEGSGELQDLLRSLQQWVCELLIKNQELRMALESAAAQGEKRDGYCN